MLCARDDISNVKFSGEEIIFGLVTNDDRTSSENQLCVHWCVCAIYQARLEKYWVLREMGDPGSKPSRGEFRKTSEPL